MKLTENVRTVCALSELGRPSRTGEEGRSDQARPSRRREPLSERPRGIDIAIIGGGPGGLAAALYAARGRAKTVVFERGIPGGQIMTTDWIENYPGFPQGLSGAELGVLMTKQAEEHGAILRTFSPIESLTTDGNGFLLTSEGDEFLAKCVILATGAVPRKLGVPGEAEFTGRGVSWCATCDARCSGQGRRRRRRQGRHRGGDVPDEFASRVCVVHRRDELRATKCIQERCFMNEKIEMHWNRTVAEILGAEGKVTGVRLESTVDEPEELLPVDGVFIFVGVHPTNELATGLCDLDERGYIRIDHDGRTSVPGLFAAGDVTDSELKQVITAAGKGASAAFEALRYIDTTTVCTI
jgi:thioredoxin reductase (NADPH)